MTGTGRPEGLLARIDGALYRVELGVITGALLAMTVTYFLQIVHRQMRAEVTKFDELFLRFAGYSTLELAPPAAIETVTLLVTPAVLGVFAFLMAVLAFRMRDKVDRSRGVEVRPSSRLRRAGAALLAVLVAAALLQLVAKLPPRWMCLLAFALLLALPVLRGLREGRRGAAVGSVVGLGFAAAFFWDRGRDAYIWSAELSSVLLMYVGFFGATMATRDGKHISVDAVRKKVPLRHLPLYDATSGLVTVLFCGLLLALAFSYLRGQIEHGNVMQASTLPEWVISLPIAVGFLLMLLRFLGRVVHDLGMWRRGEVPPPPAVDLH